MAEQIDTNYILERVGVQPPYFALKNLKFDKENGTISGEVPIEQYSEMEHSPITAAESGRHLAILGCCLLSLVNTEKGKFYYLASSAIYKSYFTSDAIDTKFLLGYASGNFTKKREGNAKAQLKTVNQKLLCDLDVSYHIFPERIFQRFFSQHKHEPIKCAKKFNPYKNIPNFTSIQTSNENKTLKATLNNLSPENCLGHFPMYSAIPIAIMAHHLVSASGQLLKKLTNINDLRYYVEQVKLSAPYLCFVNENLNLQINFSENKEKSYTFHGIANTDTNKPVGEMTITLKTII